jgi:UDP-N-acetylglucosamine 2-epimerase (non-hydrolysing)
MPYTNRSRENLLAEGFPTNRVHVTGNPIKQIICRFASKISASKAMEELGVQTGKYFLATMHRAENVDTEDRLRELVKALASLYKEYEYPVLCSLHPRTRSRLDSFQIDISHAGLRLFSPLGFCDFIHLEQNAFCVLSDSGTVQEEACIFGVPNVTIRDVTERPETVDCGSNILSGVDTSSILAAVRFVTSQKGKWVAPPEYLVDCVAETVCRIILSYRPPELSEVSWRQRTRG